MVLALFILAQSLAMLAIIFLNKSVLQRPIMSCTVIYFWNDFFPPDLIVVIASIIVLSVGSNGQVFATSAIRYTPGGGGVEILANQSFKNNSI